jgi:hypothetical protein
MKEPLMSERNTRLLSVAIVVLIWSLPGLVRSQDFPTSSGPSTPLVGSQSETPPRPKSPASSGKKSEAKPLEIGHELGPQKNPKVLRSVPKKEKKQIKMEGPTPVGRPDLKPEFARPEKAPGPPLGDRGAEEEKKR